MSEYLARYELFEYDPNMPFLLFEVAGKMNISDRLLNHWHEELEIVYYVKGGGRHYINGECVVAKQGRIVVTNSGFVHNILPDENVNIHDETVVIVIIIHPKFLEDIFPDYKKYYFINKKDEACDDVKNVIQELKEYNNSNRCNSIENLKAKSLIIKLLYLMCGEGIVERDTVDNINVLKNIERIKGVIQYVEKHYMDNISQSMIAKKFYFSSVYFSRYFKNCTGMTFTDYLASYRVEKARALLLETTKTVTQIAQETGFSDDRRLIIAFKNKHGITPLQYRKKHR